MVTNPQTCKCKLTLGYTLICRLVDVHISNFVNNRSLDKFEHVDGHDLN